MKKVWLILLAVVLAFGLVFVSCGGGGDDEEEEGAKTGWTHDLGTPKITLEDNFEYGDGYQAYFKPRSLFDGKKIEEGDEYTLKMKFTVSRDLEGLLLAGLVDQNPAGYNTKPDGKKSDYHTVLSYTQGNDPADGTKNVTTIAAGDADDVENGAAIIGPNADTILKAGTTYTVEVRFTALKSSSGTNPDYNTICFQTRGVGIKPTPGSGLQKKVDIVCEEFIFIKGDGGDSVTPPPPPPPGPPEGAISLGDVRYQKGDGDEDDAESQACWTTQDEGFTMDALKEATSLVVVFENAIAGGMQLIWQGMPGWSGWNSNDILENSGAGKEGITTVSEDSKTLTITLATAIKDYDADFAEQTGVQLVLAYYSGANKMRGLSVVTAYLVP